MLTFFLIKKNVRKAINFHKHTNCWSKTNGLKNCVGARTATHCKGGAGVSQNEIFYKVK